MAKKAGMKSNKKSFRNLVWRYENPQHWCNKSFEIYDWKGRQKYECWEEKNMLTLIINVSLSATSNFIYISNNRNDKESNGASEREGGGFRDKEKWTWIFDPTMKRDFTLKPPWESRHIYRTKRFNWIFLAILSKYSAFVVLHHLLALIFFFVLLIIPLQNYQSLVVSCSK